MKTLVIIMTALILSSCQHMDHQEKTSPCVSLGNTDGPCERFPINIAANDAKQENHT